MKRVLVVLACAAGLQAQNCTYTVSPLETGIGPGGGAGKIQVGVDPRCFWAAVSNAPWITLDATPGSVHSGGGLVTWTVPANPSPEPRRGTVSLANATVTLTQAGAGAPPVVLSSVANGASQSRVWWAPARFWSSRAAGSGLSIFFHRN